MNKCKILLVVLLVIMFFKSQVLGQDVSTGLGAPSYGVLIKANFPGANGGWSRGYRISNQDNTEKFFGLGAMGSINNGISSFSYGWVGKSYDKASLYFLANGNVGLGVKNPSERFEIYNSTTSPGVLSLRSNRNDAQHVDVGRITAKQLETEVARIGLSRGKGTYTGYLTFWTKAENSEELKQSMVLDANGNLGIGTNNTNGYKLAVKGSMAASEIKVLDVNSWADFVFAENYQLKSLTELEHFIKENKHLPDIPSKEEVKNNGISVCEMDARLLQKIEELTLYVIEQQKLIQELQYKVNRMENSNK